MSELPLSSKYRDRAADPVDEDERNDLAARLADHFTAGRITQAEYLARLDALYRAQVLGDLVGVVDGLPPKSTHAVPAIVQQGGVPGVVNEGKALAPTAVLAAAGVGVLAVIAIVLMVLLAL